jgi:hypothetical protein
LLFTNLVNFVMSATSILKARNLARLGSLIFDRVHYESIVRARIFTKLMIFNPAKTDLIHWIRYCSSASL